MLHAKANSTTERGGLRTFEKFEPAAGAVSRSRYSRSRRSARLAASIGIVTIVGLGIVVLFLVLRARFHVDSTVHSGTDQPGRRTAIEPSREAAEFSKRSAPTALAPGAGRTGVGARRPALVRTWFARHARSRFWLIPILVIIGVIPAITIDASQRPGGSVTTESRSFPTDSGRASEAPGNGADIRPTPPERLEAAERKTRDATRDRAAAGAQLLSNPALNTSAEAEAALRSGHLDSRILVLLGQLLAERELTLHVTPLLTGETGEVQRQALLTTGNPERDQDLERLLSAMTGSYAPESISRTGQGVLVTYPTEDPNVLSAE